MAVRECLLVLSYSSTNCSLIRWHSPAPRVIRLQCQLSANTTFLKSEFNVSQTKVFHLSIFFKGSSGFRHILKSGEDCRLSSGIPKGMKEHATHPYCSIKRLRQGGCGEREGGSGTARRRWGEVRWESDTWMTMKTMLTYSRLMGPVVFSKGHEADGDGLQGRPDTGAELVGAKAQNHHLECNIHNVNVAFQKHGWANKRFYRRVHIPPYKLWGQRLQEGTSNICTSHTYSVCWY